MNIYAHQLLDYVQLTKADYENGLITALEYAREVEKLGKVAVATETDRYMSGRSLDNLLMDLDQFKMNAANHLGDQELKAAGEAQVGACRAAIKVAYPDYYAKGPVPQCWWKKHGK